MDHDASLFVCGMCVTEYHSPIILNRYNLHPRQESSPEHLRLAHPTMSREDGPLIR